MKKIALFVLFVIMRINAYCQAPNEIQLQNTAKTSQDVYYINEDPKIKNGKPYTGTDSMYVVISGEKLLVIETFTDGFKSDLQTFFDNGNPDCHYQWKNHKREGVSKRWFKSGKVMYNSVMINGEISGTEIIFFENGNPEIINDKKTTGVYMEFYQNGKMKTLAKHYNDSIKCGGKDGFEETGWHEDGQLFFKRIENCGKQTFKWYHNDTTLASEGTEIDMSLFPVGKYSEYYKNGKLFREGYYEDANTQSEAGFKTGTWKYWNEKGKLLREEYYEHNVLKGAKNYSPEKAKKTAKPILKT